MTKKNQKNSRKTKKNQTWASDQTFSEKFWFFGLLVFSSFRGTSQLFDFSLGEKPWGKPKNLEKTKKPKLFRECLVWGSCLFFLVSPRFFWFFLVMTLKKLKKLKVFLVFWINWWLKNCEKPKKLRSFLVFCMDCCYMFSKNLSKNQKRPEFFLFFALLQVRVPSKNQKNLEFFSFFKVMTKKNQKNLGKTKKNKHEPQTKHSLKSFGFLVFWFSRGFLVFGLLEV